MRLNLRLALFFLRLGLLCLAFLFFAAEFLAQTEQLGGFGGCGLEDGRRRRGDHDRRRCGYRLLLRLGDCVEKLVEPILVPFCLFGLTFLFLTAEFLAQANQFGRFH